MSSLGLVWSIAKDALAAQSYGMDVTAHNIANVNTAGYSRQSPIYETVDPVSKNNLIFGRGVGISQVTRATDQFIETRLMQQQSSLQYSNEMENYAKVLEGIFSENSESSVSSMLSDFWNLWQDISNNPTGTPERSALFEHTLLLSEKINSQSADLAQLKNDLTTVMGKDIDRINEITAQVADLNHQIVGLETGNNIANDLRDKRNTLLGELSGLIDVKAFEQDNGTLTVASARGCILVQGSSNYAIELGGTNGDRVMWQSSGGSSVDMTDYITNGKMGGCLDMRDEIIAKYQRDLDAFAKEFIWSVNQQHSQGVGLTALSTVTGTYAVTTPAAAITASGLSYHDKVDDSGKTFKIWLYDIDGAPYDSDTGTAGLQDNPITITVTPGMTINGLVTAIDDETGVKASLDAQNRLSISIDTVEIPTLGAFAFSDDTSNVLAAIGINTYFTGTSAGDMGVNDKIGSELNLIATGQINSAGTFSVGNNSNAMAITDLQYTTMDISKWACDRIGGNTAGSVKTSVEDYYHSLVGSIGITARGISSTKVFNELMIDKLSGIRDSVSAVSLDEEMANLMQFQHAYAAASKLIAIADEMLATLLKLK